MNDDRKQVLKENLDTLKDRLLQIDAIRRRAQDELDHLPDVELCEDLRDYYSDAVDNLDSFKTDLEYQMEDVIENVEDILQEEAFVGRMEDKLYE